MFFQNAWAAFCQALGIGVAGQDLSAAQMGLRAAVVYLAWLAAVRFADKRLLGKYSPFDLVLAVILGAVLGRAINGSSPFFETMGAGAVLVGMHWVFAILSARSHGFGKLVKGEERLIVSHPAGHFTGEIAMISGQKCLVRGRITKAGEVLELGQEALRTY